MLEADQTIYNLSVVVREEIGDLWLHRIITIISSIVIHISLDTLNFGQT